MGIDLSYDLGGLLCRGDISTAEYYFLAEIEERRKRTVSKAEHYIAEGIRKRLENLRRTSNAI